MTIMTEKETADKKFAVLQLLDLIFPKYKVNFTPRSIIFTMEGQQIMIDEDNFTFLQEAIKDIFCMKSSGLMDQQTFNPANDKAKDIAAKLMRGRERVAAQKDGGQQSSIFSQYLSVLTVGLKSMSLQECMDLTMFQMFDLVERYGLYVSWDIDIRSRLAGGKPEGQPDNWMKNIH